MAPSAQEEQLALSALRSRLRLNIEQIDALSRHQKLRDDSDYQEGRNVDDECLKCAHSWLPIGLADTDLYQRNFRSRLETTKSRTRNSTCVKREPTQSPRWPAIDLNCAALVVVNSAGPVGNEPARINERFAKP